MIFPHINHRPFLLIIIIEKSMDNMILVKDTSGSFQEKHLVSAQTTLKELRAMIKIPEKYDSFTFVDEELVSIGLGSEEKALVQSYTGEDNKLTIELATKQSGQQKKEAQKENQEQIEKSMKTKTLVQGWIGELEKLNQKTDLKAKERQKLLEEKLGKLKAQLDNQKIQFTFNSSTNVSEVIKCLNNYVDEQTKYIQELEKVKFFSLNELARQFPNSICIGLLRGKKTLIQIIDFEKSVSQIDASQNQILTHQFSYSSQDIEKKHSLSIQTQCSGASISMMGGSPLFFLQGSASYDSAWQRKTQSTKETKYTQYVKTMFASYIGCGIKFTQTKIIINQDFRNSFKQIYEIYKNQQIGKEKPSQQFMQQAKKFFEKYGTHVEAGTYYLGNTYFSKVSCKFKQEQDIDSTKTLSSKALAVSVAGGGIFQGGFFAARASLSITSEVASDSSIQTLKSNMQTFSYYKCNPYILNMNKWSEVIPKINAFWKVVCKDVVQIPIFDILQNIQNQRQLKMTQKHIHDFGQVMMRCFDSNFQSQQGNVIQLSVPDFSQILKEVKLLNQKQKETKILRINRRSQQCTNYFIKSQIFCDEGCNMTLTQRTMNIIQLQMDPYLVRKTETIQKQIINNQVVHFIQLKGKQSSILDSKKDFIQKVNQLSTLECTYLWIYSCKNAITQEDLLCLSKNFMQLEELRLYADIPVIYSSAMREFGRSLRVLPDLKLKLFVNNKYQGLQTTPNWTSEIVKKGVITYEAKTY